MHRNHKKQKNLKSNTMSPETKIISKKRFEAVESKFDDRVEQEARRKISQASEEDRLRLTMESHSPLHITDVEVLSSPEDVSVFKN